METPADGSQVGSTAGNTADGHALAAIEPLEGGGAVLAELARAVEHDLATPDHAPATERAYVRRLLRRYSRARGTAARKKEPLLIEQLPAILMAMPDDELAMRDRALLRSAMRGRFDAVSWWRSTLSSCGFQRRGATSESQAPRTIHERGS